MGFLVLLAIFFVAVAIRTHRNFLRAAPHYLNAWNRLLCLRSPEHQSIEKCLGNEKKNLRDLKTSKAKRLVDCFLLKIETRTTVEPPVTNTSHRRTPLLSRHFFWPQGCPFTEGSTVFELVVVLPSNFLAEYNCKCHCLCQRRQR